MKTITKIPLSFVVIIYKLFSGIFTEQDVRYTRFSNTTVRVNYCM